MTTKQSRRAAKTLVLGAVGLFVYFFVLVSAHAAPAAAQQPAYGPFNPPPGVITAEKLYDARQSIYTCLDEQHSENEQSVLNVFANHPNQYRRTMLALQATSEAILDEARERMGLGDYRPFDTGMKLFNGQVRDCYQKAFNP